MTVPPPHRPGPPGTPPPPAEQLPEPGEWDQWMRSRMFDRRTVLLSGELDDTAANRVSMELMTLDATGDDAVTLHLDSGGGSVAAALAVMDVVELLGVPVNAFGLGQVAGPAVGVLAVCPHRSLARHARVRLFEPPVEVEGNAAQLAQWAAVHQDRWRVFCDRLAAATGQPATRVRQDCAAGVFLTAAEAVAYGLADEVAGPTARIHPFPRPMGFGPR